MNILQICSKPPYPKKDGYSIAVNHISDALINKGNQLKVISISTPKHCVEEMPKNYKEEKKYEDIFIDTSINLYDAFINLFSNKSYNIDRFFTKYFAKRLKTILNNDNYDIVILEGLFVTPYVNIIRKESNAKIILRAHNIESDIWDGLSKNKSNYFKKWYLNLLKNRLLDYELETLKKMDGIMCISDNDAKWMKKRSIIETTNVPFTINTDKNIVLSNHLNTIFHIGSMDWRANQVGVSWFINEVLPIVINKKSDTTLHLAGRNMPDTFINKKTENIIIHSEVDNAKEFMNKFNLMIVPLHNGSGIRIKILEAMALGKTIISTTVGASGIIYEDNVNILIADNKEDFAERIIWCLNNPHMSNQIGRKAKANILDNYSNSMISDKIDNYLNKILNS